MGDWIQTLTDELDSYWKQNSKALTLAQVPAVLRRKGLVIAEILAGRKLKDAILQDSGGRFQIVQNPEDQLVWGLVPSAAASDDETGFFRPSKALQFRTAKFERAVWTAFVVDLPENHRRFMLLHPTPRFVDVSDKDGSPAGALEIDRSEIYTPTSPPEDPELRQKNIADRINAWLDRHGVDRNLALVRKDNKAAGGTRLGRKLDISHLSERDLARISIPLDVALKIIFE